MGTKLNQISLSDRIQNHFMWFAREYRDVLAYSFDHGPECLGMLFVGVVAVQILEVSKFSETFFFLLLSVVTYCLVSCFVVRDVQCLIGRGLSSTSSLLHCVPGMLL